MVKKVSLLAASMLMLLVLFTSCQNPTGPETPKETFYKVTFDADGGTPNPAYQKIKSGAKAVKPTEIPVKNGFKFVYWMDSSNAEFDFETPITSNITLKAYYKEALTVTFDTDGGTPQPAVQNVFEGEKAVKPATDPAKRGYKFLYWMNDSEVFNFETPITSNITLKAQYEALPSYTLTINKNIAEAGTVTIDPNETQFFEGESFTLTVAANEGYGFVNWNGDTTKTELTYTGTFGTANITVEANFAPVYTLTIDKNIDAAGTVTIEPNQNDFLKGEFFTLTAVPNEGYRFVNWNGDETKTDLTYTGTFDTADITVTANFEYIPYSITASIPHATVTLDPQKDSYKIGDVVEVSIVPDEGYQFTGWTSGLTGKDKTQTLAVGSANITLDAKIVERWLVLVHFALDNDIDYNFENKYGIISNYISTLEELEENDTDDVMDILLLMDTYTASDPRNNGYTTTFTDGYYKLTGGVFANDLVETTGEINSGSIQTSKDFIDWAYENSAGKRVMYSVFNHGSGFDDPNETATFGIGFDDSNNGDSLSHKELAQVTAYIKDKAGKNIDLFFPYACLMGGIELAWEVKDNADYLLCSEESFPAEYWSYEALCAITDDPEIASEDLGKVICDNAYDYFSNPYIDRDLTLSLIDLSELQSLYNALDTLASEMTSQIGTDVDIASGLDYAAARGLFMSTPYYTDIGVFMDRIDYVFDNTSISFTNPVRSALNSAVVYKKNFTSSENDVSKTRYDNASGLTIFHNIWNAQYSMIKYNPSLYQSILTFGNTNAWGAYTQKLYDLTPAAPNSDTKEDTYEPDGLDTTVTNLLDKGELSKQLHTFHLIDNDQDIDVMAVQLEQDKIYTFMTEAGSIGTDTYLVLLDPSGNYIGENDDISATNAYSKITYTATSSGYYFLVVINQYYMYGDYYVYFDEGTLGSEVYEPSFNKWSPNNKNVESLFN